MELEIQIGSDNPGRCFDLRHGDITDVQPDGSDWGLENRERVLIVRVPDLTQDEIDKIWSNVYAVKSSEVAAKQADKNAWVNTGYKLVGNKHYPRIVQARQYRFDFTLLNQNQQDLIEAKKLLSKSNMFLYTANLSLNIILGSFNLIEKPPVVSDNNKNWPEKLDPGEEYITGYTLRQLEKG